MVPLRTGILLALASTALVFAIQTGHSPLGPIGAGLGVWVVWGALSDLWSRTGRENLATRASRLTRLPRADWGKAASHAGFGITLFAVAAMNAWSLEVIRVLAIGESFKIGAYDVQLTSVKGAEGPNYTTTIAEMQISRAGAHITTQFPEKQIGRAHV